MTRLLETRNSDPMVSRRFVRTKTLFAASLVVVFGWSSVGCTTSDNDHRSGASEVSRSSVSATAVPAPPATASAAELAAARLEEAITSDREGALFFIDQNGGCQEMNTERCIANMLLFIAPDSPAIAPALQQAALADAYLQAVAQAEKDRQLGAFYAGVAAAEAAKAAEQAKVDSYLRTVAAADQAKAAAIQIGENLLDAACFGNGGTYNYWTDPPGAEVTSCNAPTQASSGSGGRTGAICNDGWRSSATGSGACSHHGGVDYWTY